jgi:hypothetical protein
MNIWSLLHIDYQKPEDKPVDVVDFKLGHYPHLDSLTYRGVPLVYCRVPHRNIRPRSLHRIAVVHW